MPFLGKKPTEVASPVDIAYAGNVICFAAEPKVGAHMNYSQITKLG